MKIILLLSVLFSSVICSADIIYFDMNNSPAEILTAEKAAAARGERLVVFPPRTREQQQILNQVDELDKQKLRVNAPGLEAYRRMDAARTQRAAEAAKPQPNAAKLRQLDATIAEQSIKMNQFTAAQTQLYNALNERQARLCNTVSIGPNLPANTPPRPGCSSPPRPSSMQDLERLIASYNVPGKSITSVIFSGHHDFGSYTGALGSVQKEEIARIFNKYPEAKSTVKSVYGWGCYSSTVAEKDWWLRTFPAVQVVGGFDAGAPGKDRPASLGYLRDSLVKEAELIRLATDRRTAHDVNRIRRFVNSYNGFTMTNAAICTRGVYVGRNTGSFDLSQPNGLCSQDALTELVENTGKLNRIINGLTDVPCDGTNSWIRKFYNLARTHQHCGAELGPLQAQFKTYTSFADRIIRIIDSKEVLEHFRAYYVNDLKALKANQARCGYSVPNLGAELKCEAPPMQNPNSPKITRLQLMQFTEQLWNSPCAKKRPVTVQNLPVAKMNNIFVKIIRRQQCIPLSWVTEYEPGKAIDRPNCDSQ